jgi:hypothetical protein
MADLGKPVLLIMRFSFALGCRLFLWWKHGVRDCLAPGKEYTNNGQSAEEYESESKLGHPYPLAFPAILSRAVRECQFTDALNNDWRNRVLLEYYR